MHFGDIWEARNTKERIRLSFYWPTMASDIKRYVETCKLCSLRRRVIVYDGVSIIPTGRNEKNCDVLGPLLSNGEAEYQVRSCDKHFGMTEQESVLTLGSATRVWSRWKAPATVVEVKSPKSYIIEIDGRRQHAYSNKLRRYDVRVDEVICNTLVMSDMTIDSCSIVHDKDKNFRPIRTVGKVESGQGERLPSRMIGLPADKWSHQTETQHREYLGMRSSGCSFIRAIKKILQPTRDVTELLIENAQLHSIGRSTMYCVFLQNWKTNRAMAVPDCLSRLVEI